MYNISGAIRLGALVAGATFVSPLWAQSEGLGPATACTGAVCSIDVTIREGSSAAQPGCKVVVSSETAMPLGINSVEWRIKTAGFSFAAGGPGVTIHNNASNFSPAAGSTPTIFKLKRSPTVPQGREYEYDLKIQKNGSTVFCMVPTLPRIKNQ